MLCCVLCCAVLSDAVLQLVRNLVAPLSEHGLHGPPRLYFHPRSTPHITNYHSLYPQVRRGVPVLTVRRGIQTAAFLGPVAALMALANPAISPPLALLSMTAALGITSLGKCCWVAEAVMVSAAALR